MKTLLRVLVLTSLLALPACSAGQKVQLEFALEGPPAIAEWFPRLVLTLEVEYEFAPIEVAVGAGGF